MIRLKAVSRGRQKWPFIVATTRIAIGIEKYLKFFTIFLEKVTANLMSFPSILRIPYCSYRLLRL